MFIIYYRFILRTPRELLNEKNESIIFTRKNSPANTAPNTYFIVIVYRIHLCMSPLSSVMVSTFLTCSLSLSLLGVEGCSTYYYFQVGGGLFIITSDILLSYKERIIDALYMETLCKQFKWNIHLHRIFTYNYTNDSDHNNRHIYICIQTKLNPGSSQLPYSSDDPAIRCGPSGPIVAH